MTYDTKNCENDTLLLINNLANKDNVFACSSMEKLKNDKSAYKYFNQIFSLINHKSSFVRNRAIILIGSLSEFDTENKTDKIIDKFLLHLNDEKPITVRQCIKSTLLIYKNKPYLKSKILYSLNNINLKNYAESMKPLIEKDIKNAIKTINEG